MLLPLAWEHSILPINRSCSLKVTDSDLTPQPHGQPLKEAVPTMVLSLQVSFAPQFVLINFCSEITFTAATHGSHPAQSWSPRISNMSVLKVHMTLLSPSELWLHRFQVFPDISLATPPSPVHLSGFSAADFVLHSSLCLIFLKVATGVGGSQSTTNTDIFMPSKNV